jgi:TrmH family RNA methyltransferase
VCVLEGPDLVVAALDAGAHFEAVYVDAAHQSTGTWSEIVQLVESKGVRVFALASGVLASVSDAQTPQPLLATVRLPLVELNAIPTTGLVVVLHDVRDPGNAGTIIRSVDASGAAAVVFSGQSVDPFNPKTLRASAGSVFRVTVCVSDLATTIAHFSSGGARVLASVARGGVNHREVDFLVPTVVLIGNEASGLDDGAIAMCDARITIPMQGTSESLNAAIAASLIAFEALYQRQDASSTSSPRSLEGS